MKPPCGIGRPSNYRLLARGLQQRARGGPVGFHLDAALGARLLPGARVAEEQLEAVPRQPGQRGLGPLDHADAVGIGQVILEAEVGDFLRRDAVEIHVVDRPRTAAPGPVLADQHEARARRRGVRAEGAREALDEGRLPRAERTEQAQHLPALKPRGQTRGQRAGRRGILRQERLLQAA